MGIRVKILDIPTTLTDFPPEQGWVFEMINAILIEVLGAIAENERILSDFLGVCRLLFQYNTSSIKLSYCAIVSPL